MCLLASQPLVACSDVSICQWKKKGNTYIETFCAAPKQFNQIVTKSTVSRKDIPRVVPGCDVVESTRGLGIQERVQEPEGRKPFLEPGVVKQADETYAMFVRAIGSRPS